MKTPIATTNAPGAIGPYSQAIDTGSFVFISGQIPVNPATGEVPEGIKAQAAQSAMNSGHLHKSWLKRELKKILAKQLQRTQEVKD